MGDLNVKTNIDNLNSATTGISYSNTSNVDLTTIDNNVVIASGKTLTVGTTNIITSIGDLNYTLSGVTFDPITDTTTVDNNLNVTKNLIANGSVIDPTELSYLDGVTSNIQSQIDSKANSANPSFTGTMNLASNILANGSTITPTELSSLDGVTSNIQTQINARAQSYDPSFSGTMNLNSNIHANGKFISPTEISHLDNVTSNIQTQLNSKANSSNPSFSGTMSLASNVVANGATITPTELSYLDGVTSNIQTQINSKLNSSGPNMVGNAFAENLILNGYLTMNGQIIADGKFVNKYELSFLDGVTSSLQTQLNSKANSANPSFTGTMSLSSNILTNGATITPTELSSLDGISSNIQTQLDNKLDTTDPSFIGTISGPNYEVPFNPNGDIFQDVVNYPPVNCGVVKGTGDGVSYTTFNQAIVSWWSTAFIDSCFKTVKAFIDHRTGNFFSKGSIYANGAVFEQNVTSSTLSTTTANITNATISNYTNPAPCFIGAYVIMTNGGGMQPIFCTIKNTANYYTGFQSAYSYVGVTNGDYGYVVFPGYKLEVYRHPSFGGIYGLLGYDNTNGTVPVMFSNDYKDVGSWKLYYKGTEVLVATMSTAT